MVTGKSRTKHCINFARLCARMVEETDAVLLFGCEIGAFRQGPSHARLRVRDILRGPFGESVRVAEVHNYLAVWGFGGASQPGASQPGPCSGGASQPSVIVVSTRMQAKVGPVFSHNNKVNTQAARIWSILVD